MNKIAYAYLRFSNQSQSEGQTVERQTDMAQEYVTKHGLTLDTKLNMRDLGVSAYKGKNSSDGALSLFIKAIEEKKVLPGSFLLVEDIDRLSRLPVMDALAVFQRIIGGGVTIVTLKDEVKYSLERLRNDWTPLMPVLFAMARGHGESERKSYLIGKAWKAKKVEARKTLRPYGNLAPAWLDFEPPSDDHPEGRYVEKADRVALINRIFTMSINGMGKMAIAMQLNSEGVKPFAKPYVKKADAESEARRKVKRTGKWSGSSLQRLLGNRALLGEYQPYEATKEDEPYEGTKKDRKPSGKPIADFYPNVINQLLFDQAQEANRLRKATGTTNQSKEFYNVWQGIGKCARCHGALHIRDKTYLICYRTRIGDCDGKYIRLDGAELFYREILAKVNGLSLVQASSDELRHQLVQAQARMRSLQRERDDYKALLQRARSPATFDLLVAAEAAIEEGGKDIEAILKKLAQDTIVDKHDFFARVDLKSTVGRNKSNVLLKQLGVEVFIDAGVYGVVQSGTPLFDLAKDHTGTIVSLPHTADQFELTKQQDAPTVSAMIKAGKARRKAAGIPERTWQPGPADDVGTHAEDIKPMDWGTAPFDPDELTPR
jgi:DNA invertase Pin-like site-specific DNA recombinase